MEDEHPAYAGFVCVFFAFILSRLPRFDALLLHCVVFYSIKRVIAFRQRLKLVCRMVRFCKYIFNNVAFVIFYEIAT